MILPALTLKAYQEPMRDLMVDLPRCGVLWSTTVAASTRPPVWHMTHSGWLARCRLRACCHFHFYTSRVGR